MAVVEALNDNKTQTELHAKFLQECNKPDKELVNGYEDMV